MAAREGAVVPGQRVLNRAQDQGERRAQLVADVAEEGGLRLIQLGQRFGAPAFALEGLRVGDAGGDLTRGEVQKSGIARSRIGDRDSARR